MKVSKLTPFDVSNANSVQEVAKVVHLWPTSNPDKLYERDQHLIQRSDWW